MGKRLVCFLATLVVIFALAYGAYYSFSDMSYINSLEKPYFYPPDVAFRVVWPMLYFLMALSFVIFSFDSKNVFPKILFGIHFLDNISTGFVFSLKSLDLLVGHIFFLWLGALWVMSAFWKRSWVSGALLLPYIFWLTFAFTLSVTMWFLNN